MCDGSREMDALTREILFSVPPERIALAGLAYAIIPINPSVTAVVQTILRIWLIAGHAVTLVRPPIHVRMELVNVFP